ncbi:MAG: phosphoheptose isomerase [Candidatus Cloacimonas sp. SDB]|nr:MAG: phosphoheptose isomerase [Candidatus Cloacimonas sp. SDB]
MKDIIKKDLKQIEKLVLELGENEALLDSIVELTEEIVKAIVNGNKVLICGNGGSAADAMHFAEEFTGRFRKSRRALPVISLTDPTHITCVGNDYGFDEIFSRSVEAFGQKHDLLIAISTSGNSANIIEAIKKADELNMVNYVLAGKRGGKVKEFTQNMIIVPGKETERIQELHGMILHIIIEMVERSLFPENYEGEV